jgi:hypothetical protein
MDVDDILSQFGEKSKSKANNAAFDVDSILSEFGGKSEPVTLSGKPSVITVTPKPPISGISKEASDELNQTRLENKGGENPRSKLPTTSIQDSMAEHGIAAKELLGSAATDAETGHPYKAIGKGLLGLMQGAISPFTGAIEGAISTPITDVTGNKDIGDRAGFVANSAIPVPKGLNILNKTSAGLPVVNKLSTFPKNKALSQIIEHIGPENLSAAVSALKANPRLAPADLSPRVLQDTQNLFVTEGGHINYLANTSGARVAGAKDAVTAAYDASAGTPVNVVQKLNDLAEASKKVGAEKINPAIKDAGPVDVSSTVNAIDKILKPGVNSVISSESSLPLTAVKKELVQIKTMLANDKEMRTGAADLHKFQAGLRRTAEGLLKSASGADREMGNALMNVRNNLVSDIDKASGGKYKSALSSYRDEMHIADSFRNGYEGVFSNSKKMENMPEFTKKWFDGLTDAEKEAAKEGARTAIHTEIGVAKNGALSGTNLAKSDFNKEKLEILFGKEEAQTLIKKLEDERAIANTHNKIAEGSQTAMRSASKEGRSLPTLKDIGTNIAVGTGMETANILAHGYPGVGTALLTSANLANRGAHNIKTKIAKEINMQYAKLALPTEGPSRDALIQSLEAAIPGPKQSIVRRGANSLSRLVAP